MEALVGYIGLGSLSLDLVALVGKAQGSVGSFYGAGVNLAWWVKVGSTWLATRYGPKGAAQTCSGPTKKSCEDIRRKEEVLNNTFDLLTECKTN